MSKELNEKQKKNVLIRYMRSLKQSKLLNSSSTKVAIETVKEDKTAEEKLTERAVKELEKAAAGEPVVEYKTNKRFLKTTIDQCLSYNKRKKTKEKTMSRKNLELLNEQHKESESGSSSSCEEVTESKSKR